MPRFSWHLRLHLRLSRQDQGGLDRWQRGAGVHWGCFQRSWIQVSALFNHWFWFLLSTQIIAALKRSSIVTCWPPAWWPVVVSSSRPRAATTRQVDLIDPTFPLLHHRKVTQHFLLLQPLFHLLLLRRLSVRISLRALSPVIFFWFSTRNSCKTKFKVF